MVKLDDLEIGTLPAPVCSICGQDKQYDTKNFGWFCDCERSVMAEGSQTLTPSQKEFNKLLLKMKEIHDAKSMDYATNEDRFKNFRLCELMDIPAWKGIIVRLGDKYSRICEFAKKEEFEVKDESFEDTCIDGANYFLLLLQAYRDYKRRQE